MISIIQRVKSANVMVNAEIIGAINQGILAFVAIEPQDTQQDAQRLLLRILSYRVFEDTAGKMNLNVGDVSGGVLIVPQFTLAADTQKGNRPSFTTAAMPEQAFKLFDYFSAQARANYHTLAFGQFGADMQVSLVNDGPVTFILRTPLKTTV